MLVFVEGEKPSKLGENQQQIQPTYDPRLESNPGHIVRRWALSLVYQPCSPNNGASKNVKGKFSRPWKNILLGEQKPSLDAALIHHLSFSRVYYRLQMEINAGRERVTSLLSREQSRSLAERYAAVTCNLKQAPSNLWSAILNLRPAICNQSLAKYQPLNIL